VCKTFHILPSDPVFRKLNVVQLMWIIQNMVNDANELNEAADSKVGSMNIIKSDPDLMRKKIEEFKNRPQQEVVK